MSKQYRSPKNKQPFITYTIVKSTGWYKLSNQYTIQTGIKDAACEHKKIKLDKDGNLTLPTGFRWNGVTAFPDLDSMMRGSCVHDALYELMIAGKLDRDQHKYAVDSLMRKIFIKDGCPRVFANGAFAVVRKFSFIAEMFF